jgi:hypothetical protein
MQKLIRITDNMYGGSEEILNEYLQYGWKVINMITTSTSRENASYFHTLILLEKE